VRRLELVQVWEQVQEQVQALELVREQVQVQEQVQEQVLVLRNPLLSGLLAE
jgi:hypothetical protein